AIVVWLSVHVTIASGMIVSRVRCRTARDGRHSMKLVLFQTAGETEPQPGLLTGRGIVAIAGAVAKSYTPQLTMQGIIDNFDRLRPALDKLAAEGEARPLDSVRPCPPLPRPGKILCC